jgi:hypothetical protein
MPDWTIKIVPAAAGGGAQFSPKTQQAQQDDLVCWNNTTDETHQPWPTDQNYNPIPNVARGSAQYLSDPIPPGRSSRPSYDVALPAGNPAPQTWKVYYYCQTHPQRTNERGVIVGSLIPD